VSLTAKRISVMADDKPNTRSGCFNNFTCLPRPSSKTTTLFCPSVFFFCWQPIPEKLKISNQSRAGQKDDIRFIVCMTGELLESGSVYFCKFNGIYVTGFKTKL